MKELEDYRWFPPVLRNSQTAFIGFVVARFNVYGIFIKYLRGLSIPRQPAHDLCSGSGEPAIGIFRKSDCFSRLTLSDKFPNLLPFHDDKIHYETESVDVLVMDFLPGACYTMFNAFHHFSDADKLKIIANVRMSGATAFFAEILEPKIICFLKVLVLATTGTLLFTPFIRPFSLKRLFLTYIFPVNLFTITFDGIVSVLKSRSEKHYKKLFSVYGDTVEIVRLKSVLNPVVVIHILPKK